MSTQASHIHDHSTPVHLGGLRGTALECECGNQVRVVHRVGGIRYTMHGPGGEPLLQLIPPHGIHAQIVYTGGRKFLVHLGEGGQLAGNLTGWTQRSEGNQTVLTDPEGREYDFTQHQSRSTPHGDLAIGYLRPAGNRS